jgi:23S rRNA (adenine2503-C2)-methyltransferase
MHEIIKNIKVPTGNILITQGFKGLLECLSIGDYGKDTNVKCNALGLTRKIDKVEHQKMLPLTEKWVITISTQHGCSMCCGFCDVPKVGPGINATTNDLINQVKAGLSLHPEIKETKRLNLHYARMGEPTWNPNILMATELIKEMLPEEFHFHPVVSTMMPRMNKFLQKRIQYWLSLKNELMNGEAGLQLSINSTDEDERKKMFSGNAHTIKDISGIMDFSFAKLIGRKITLNFALADYEIDPKILKKYFSPKHYIIKLTPMHKTIEALKNDIKTKGDYTTYTPYEDTEKRLLDEGYDVLVFIASKEEDMGRITCGNAILSGSKPEIYDNV